MTPTLYGTSKTRAFRPLWLLEELGLDFVHDPCPPRAPALTAISDHGKLPVLEVDGTVVIPEALRKWVNTDKIG